MKIIMKLILVIHHLVSRFKYINNKCISIVKLVNIVLLTADKFSDMWLIELVFLSVSKYCPTTKKLPNIRGSIILRKIVGVKLMSKSFV